MNITSQQFTKKLLINAAMLLPIFVLAACGEMAGNTSSNFTADAIACNTDPALDSTIGTTNSVTVISSYDKTPAPSYGNVLTRFNSNLQAVNVDYMVHEASDSNGNLLNPKGLMVLFAGGQLTAKIDGSGTNVISAGDNFVVRSAHLYARQGYKVITIDQPSDAATQLKPLNSSAGYALDTYRTSVLHAIDISAVINNVNSDLPIYFVGTSRGTISAVAQSALSNGLALSSPVTAGSQPEAFPVGSSQADPATVDVPAHVIWHANDACTKSPPAGAEDLAAYFSAGAELTGGFNHPDYLNQTCGAYVYHGYMGIESCAANAQSNWLNTIAVTGNRPAVPALQYGMSPPQNSLTIDISPYVPAGGKASLPFSGTALSGHASLTGNVITYTPPTGLALGADTFVYVITDEAGKVGHNLINVSISGY